MADQDEGVPASNPLTAQQQQQHDHAGQQQKVVHLNWSNFKAEFSGKPDEDTEACLLHSNDWMNAHHFVDGVKVQQFCLTLLGEARLWYQSLEPINIDWHGLQNLFRQQYLKIGNIREIRTINDTDGTMVNPKQCFKLYTI